MIKLKIVVGKTPSTKKPKAEIAQQEYYDAYKKETGKSAIYKRNQKWNETKVFKEWLNDFLASEFETIQEKITEMDVLKCINCGIMYPIRKINQKTGLCEKCKDVELDVEDVELDVEDEELDANEQAIELEKEIEEKELKAIVFIAKKFKKKPEVVREKVIKTFQKYKGDLTYREAIVLVSIEKHVDVGVKKILGAKLYNPAYKRVQEFLDETEEADMEEAVGVVNGKGSVVMEDFTEEEIEYTKPKKVANRLKEYSLKNKQERKWLEESIYLDFEKGLSWLGHLHSTNALKKVWKNLGDTSEDFLRWSYLVAIGCIEFLYELLGSEEKTIINIDELSPQDKTMIELITELMGKQ